MKTVQNFGEKWYRLEEILRLIAKDERDTTCMGHFFTILLMFLYDLVSVSL